MEMDPRLKKAAETGDIDALHLLIKEDPYILDAIDGVSFNQTPLHIAANEGQMSFAMEMINLKPSFAKKLNRDGFSPMHLALINEKTKLVLRLLRTDKDLVRAKGWQGMTPFLYAAATGNSKLLFNFLEACPECIEDVTVRDETALHLALKNDNVEAFKLLFGWLQRSPQAHANANSYIAFETRMVSWKDNDDNTVLHIAAIKDQREVLKLLLDSYAWLDAKAKNSEGLTALEIARKEEHRDTNIELKDEDDTKINQLRREVKFFEKSSVMGARMNSCMSVDRINTMLVVMALVITAVYQSSLSPPGGVWQDDNSDSASNITTAIHYIPGDRFFNSTLHFLNDKEPNKAGTAIMKPIAFFVFSIVNFSTFFITILQTGILLSTSRVLLLSLLPLHLLVLSYFLSMTILSPSAFCFYVNLGLVVLAYLPLLALQLAWALLIISNRQLMVERKFRGQLRQVLGMPKSKWYNSVILDFFYEQGGNFTYPTFSN